MLVSVERCLLLRLQIKPREWWHSTRIIQAFDFVLADEVFHGLVARQVRHLRAVRREAQLRGYPAAKHLNMRGGWWG